MKECIHEITMKRALLVRQYLGSSLLIAGGAVQLAAEEQAREALGLQRRVALEGWQVVVLDRIRWPQHLAGFQACSQRRRVSVRARTCFNIANTGSHALFTVALLGLGPFSRWGLPGGAAWVAPLPIGSLHDMVCAHRQRYSRRTFIAMHACYTAHPPMHRA